MPSRVRCAAPSRARLARSCRTPGPLRRTARSAPSRNTACATRSGSRRTRRQPAAYCRSVRLHGAAGSGGRSRALRRASASRWPTVHSDAAASTHSATSSAYGTPRPGEPGADEREDQPLGPLDEPADHAQARPLGPRLDVGDQLPRDQADQGGDAEHAGLADAERPPGEGGEEGAVGDAVAGGVEHRAERGALAPGPRHRAVDQVEQHEHGDAEGAEEQLPAGQEPQRRGDGAHGARDGDGVGRDPAPHEPPTERLGDAVDVRTGDDVEHLLRLSGSPPAYPAPPATRRPAVRGSRTAAAG